MIGIEKFEIEDGHVIFYLDSVGEEQERVRIRKRSDSVDFFSDHILFSRTRQKMCFSFIIEPIIHMADASEALITAYDYYEPERESSRLYQTKCNDETWLTEGVNKGREPKKFLPSLWQGLRGF